MGSAHYPGVVGTRKIFTLEHMGSVSAEKHNLVGYGFNSKARR